jgi:UDP-2,3-diacylglucosamine pyrophosphatase LpxH
VRLWVTHGDVCDDALRCARWIVVLGATLHAAAIRVNRRVNAMGSRLGFRYWPLSRVLAGKVRDAVSSLVGYEDAIALEARRRGVDGVVCGHVHKPEIRDIGGILYCNDGDWVESLTALVETDDGDLRIARWPSST